MSKSSGGMSRRQLLIAGASVPAAYYLSGRDVSASSRPARALRSGGEAPDSLSVSDWWGDQIDNYLPRMEEVTGIEIQHEVYTYAPEKIFTELASGTAPDIFMVDSPWNGNLYPYEDLYVPFDDALARSGIDMSKWNVDQVQEAGYNGKAAGLSLYTAQDFIVHVNTELAEADGLLADAPLWGTPGFDTWDWDTFVEWLKAGTKRTSSGDVEQYGLASVPVFASFYSWILHDFGGSLYDDDFNYDETTCMLDSEEAIAAAQLIADLFVKHEVAVPTGTEVAIRGGSYLAGRGVATLNLSTPTIFPEEGHFPQSYFHMPYAVQKVHTLGGGQWCVNATSDHVDAAQDWVITFLTDDVVRTDFLANSSVPSYDPLPIVEAAPEGTAKTIALINLSRIEGMSPIPENTADVAVFPRWFGRYAGSATQNAIESALHRIIDGDATAQEAMTEVKQQVDEQIAAGRQAAES